MSAPEVRSRSRKPNEAAPIMFLRQPALIEHNDFNCGAKKEIEMKKVIIATVLTFGLLSFHSALADELEPVHLDCTLEGVSGFWASGGTKIVGGSVKGFRCGEESIELKTNDIVDSSTELVGGGGIDTVKYGKLEFSVPSLHEARVVFYLTKAQKEALKEYILE